MNTKNFEELGVQQEIVQALKKKGITEPTDIQAKTIPLALEGKDVIGISKTGSGKTASFGVPTVQLVDPFGGIQALVLAPTRELAVQISREFEKFSARKIKVATVYGGVAINPQIERIAKSQIVVGTPGRVLDHLERRTLDLSKIKLFVLDEADKMVEMGFIEDVRRILSHTNETRQILLYGATISDEVKGIEREFMNSPVTVKSESHVKEEYLEQFYVDVGAKDKFSMLMHLLKKFEDERDGTIIFCSTRNTVDLVAENLKKQHLRCEHIHGKLSQNRRQNIIDKFNAGKIQLLVASTVAARGLHIDGVTHVINYDLPRDPQEYVHRIGRTARAGTKGSAYSLLAPRDHEHFAAIKRRYPHLKIQKMEPQEFPRIPFHVRRDNRGGSSRNFRGGSSRHERGRSHSGFGSRRGEFSQRTKTGDRPRRSPKPTAFKIGSDSWRERA
ncbi:DEAD/DEAH box helicase [Candidatus Woesearchaeota archaeon]|nr:MAG: DEAD/DEAH box helicase [Candidatus Woesearchaeota archaeon]